MKGTEGKLFLVFLLACELAGALAALPEVIGVLAHVSGAAGKAVGSWFAVGVAGTIGALVALAAWLVAFCALDEPLGRVYRRTNRVWSALFVTRYEGAAARRLLTGQLGAAVAGVGVLVGFAAPAFVVLSGKMSRKLSLSILVMALIAALVLGAYLFLVTTRTTRGLLARLWRVGERDCPGWIVWLPTLIATALLVPLGLWGNYRLLFWLGHLWALQMIAPLVLGTLMYLLLSRFRVQVSWWVPLVTAIVLLAGAVGGLRSELGRAAVLSQNMQGQVLAGFAARVSDADGDGFTSWFDGADCAPDDPSVGPHSREIPGNGIDENCNGLDGPRGLNAPTSAYQERYQESLEAIQPIVLGEKPDILLVTWEATRPERSSICGNERDTTPNLAALGKTSSVFTHAWSAGPRTDHALPSIMTGRNTFSIQMQRDSNTYSLDPENTTLAELLSAQGYVTGAVGGPQVFNEEYQWRQGFQHWVQAVVFTQDMITAPQETEAALKLIPEMRGDGSRPIFFWIHLMDPHDQYFAHQGTPFEMKTPVDAYDSELWFSDLHTQQIIDEFSLTARPKVIIFTADHGEGLGEHGYFGAHADIHSENVRVPLIVHVDGLPPQVVAEPVSTTDIFLTVLDLVGVDPPGGTATSLVPGLVSGSMGGRGPVFSEFHRFWFPWLSWKAVVDGDWRLIREERLGMELLYDLSNDPFEQTDLSGVETGIRTRLGSLLDDFEETTTTPARP